MGWPRYQIAYSLAPALVCPPGSPWSCAEPTLNISIRVTSICLQAEQRALQSRSGRPVWEWDTCGVSSRDTCGVSSRDTCGVSIVFSGPKWCWVCIWDREVCGGFSLGSDGFHKLQQKSVLGLEEKVSSWPGVGVGGYLVCVLFYHQAFPSPQKFCGSGPRSRCLGWSHHALSQWFQGVSVVSGQKNLTFSPPYIAVRLQNTHP